MCPSKRTTSVRERSLTGDDLSEPLLVSVDEVGRLLSVSKRTVWRLVSEEKIPQPVSFGGNTRWRLNELKDWIAKGCSVPSQNGSK